MTSGETHDQLTVDANKEARSILVMFEATLQWEYPPHKCLAIALGMAGAASENLERSQALKSWPTYWAIVSALEKMDNTAASVDKSQVNG